jgi:DNA modification methylase
VQLNNPSFILDNLDLITGDCIESMKKMPAQCVNTCVTSPPYFGLRDYGMEGQIGLEDTPDAFVERLVEVFREVKRVLRDDGTLWLNLGDSYCNTNGYARAQPEFQRKGRNDAPANDRNLDALHNAGFKTKDLIGIPWRVAFALQADGWYLRQDIIWHKPNPMPESVRDRCTKAHEYIFLMSKSPKYYYDHEAIKEEAKTAPAMRDKAGEGYQADYAKGQRFSDGERLWGADGKKNKRSVWSVPTIAYKGAHFATFPTELIEPCILAGCPEGGTVLDPFGGSGTTAGVAIAHKRKAILCELNPDYADMVNDRVSSIVKKITPNANQHDLFLEVNW